MSEAQRGSFTVALASSSIVDFLVIPGLPSLSVEMTLMNRMGQDTPLLALKLGSACGIVEQDTECSSSGVLLGSKCRGAPIGNGAAFHKGREFSSWLGLVPRQHSTGDKARLFGISKRGNNYLRKILVHGARSAVLRVKREKSPFGPWLDALEQRAPINVVITAAANKLSRIVWPVLSSGQDYRPAVTAMPA